MVKAFDILFGPGSFNVFGLVEIGFFGVVGDKADIEYAVVVAQGCRPHALPIDVLSVHKVRCGGVLVRVKDVGSDLPVYQIV